VNVNKRLGIVALVLTVSATLALATDRPTLSGPGGGGPGTTVEPEFAVLWDQPLSATNTGAYANQEFGDFATYSCFAADDIVVPAPGWTIEAIFVPNGGWNPGSAISCASMLHFEIWADNAGIPAGYPGSGTPVWSLAVPPTDPQISITTGSGGLATDVFATLTTPGNLAPGTYWFVFYPTADFAVCGQYGRNPSDTANGFTAQWINPGGAFGNGTAWQAWTVLGMTNTDTSFRLEGNVVPVELQSFSAE